MSQRIIAVRSTIPASTRPALSAESRPFLFSSARRSPSSMTSFLKVVKIYSVIVASESRNAVSSSNFLGSRPVWSPICTARSWFSENERVHSGHFWFRTFSRSRVQQSPQSTWSHGNKTG